MENDNLTGPQQSLIHTNEDRIYEVQNVDLRNILGRLSAAFSDAWLGLSDFESNHSSTATMQEKLIAKDKINRVRCLCEDAKLVLLSTVNFYGSYPESLNERLTCNTAKQQQHNSKLLSQRIHYDENQGKICGYLTLNELDLNWIIGTHIPPLLEIMNNLIDGQKGLVSNICITQMVNTGFALQQWKPERVVQRLFNPERTELRNMNFKNNSTNSQIPHVNRTGEASDEDQSVKKLPELKCWAMEAWQAHQIGTPMKQIAETLSKKYSNRKITQPRVSEQIKKACMHAELSGLAAIAAKVILKINNRAPARTLDPSIADLGNRTDGRSHLVRDKEKQKAKDGDDD